LIYLLAPATNGSSILYRKFVHPALVRREERIDAMLESVQTQSYNTAMELGQRGARYVTELVMQGALRAPALMADIVQTGQVGLEQRAANRGSLFQPQPQNESLQLAAEMRLPDIDLSDDDTVPAAPGQIVEIKDEADSGDTAMEVEEVSGPRRRRRTKAAAAAAAAESYSSGGEDEEWQPESRDREARPSAKAGGTKKAATSTTRKSTRKAK